MATDETRTLNIQLPPTLYAYIKEQAGANHHSMRDELIDILEDDKARRDGSEEAFAEKYGDDIRRIVNAMLAERA